MRRLVFILLIALLPLRGWMGEAMATEMATIHLVATQAINTPANAKLGMKISGLNDLEASADVATQSATTPADCEMHAKSASDSTPSKRLCSHCQACHAVGLAGTVRIISPMTTHSPAPAAHVSLFASASLALSQKPPIL